MTLSVLSGRCRPCSLAKAPTGTSTGLPALKFFFGLVPGEVFQKTTAHFRTASVTAASPQGAENTAHQLATDGAADAANDALGHGRADGVPARRSARALRLPLSGAGTRRLPLG